MAIKDSLSRFMRADLKRISAKDMDGWVYWPWFRSADALKRRGLVETEWREYQPPPTRMPHVKLTAKGRALLGRNEPDDT